MSESSVWVVCVVAKIQSSPNKYKSFYLGVEGDKPEAAAMQNVIAKRGFKHEGNRIFPDAIESITLKQREQVNEQLS